MGRPFSALFSGWLIAEEEESLESGKARSSFALRSRGFLGSRVIKEWDRDNWGRTVSVGKWATALFAIITTVVTPSHIAILSVFGYLRLFT